MNVCRDCNSEYERPGTCNCFAPGGTRASAAMPLRGPLGLPLEPPPPAGSTTITAPKDGVVMWVDCGGALSPRALFDLIDHEARRRATTTAVHPAAQGLVRGLRA